MKSKILLSLIIITLLFSACKKDEVDYTGFTTTGLETISPNSNYLPSKKGTFWKYTTTTNGVESTFTQTLDGTKSTFSGRDYLNFTNEAPGQQSQKGYYYMGNHEYRLRSANMGIVFDLLYLIDNKVVGDEWTDAINETGTINGVPGRVKGKILEKDITKEVLGKKYTGVYHTQAKIEYDLLGSGFESYGTYDYFIAKGVGLIEIDSNVLGVISTSKLTEYSIK